ncbi:MAG: hypothetical protein GJV46_12360 [Geobacter sp.]|nr:hypothetical protein [Geobacter sp.]
MKLKKTVAIAATAGALAAVAMPAMAFENEIHGTSRLRYFISNYENGGGGNPLSVNSAGKVPLVSGNATENQKVNNYFEQRSRLFYTAKANDDLKLVTAFEVDSVFGDRAQSQTTPSATAAGATGRNQGGAMESDTVNLETKWVYLDFKIPSTPINVSAGIQPFKDQLKGIFLDADIAGVVTNTKAGAAAIKAGYLRAYDQSFFGTGRPRGMDNLEVGVVEAKFALSKDASIGAAYYLYNDNRGNNIGTMTTNDIMIHTLGLTGDAKFGALSLSGFAAYQGGIIKTNTNGSSYLNALAYNVAAKVPVGPGTFKTAMLFTSGNAQNTGKHLTGWVGMTQAQNNSWATTAGTSTYNESGMMLLNRNAAAGTGTTDNAIVYNPGNGNNIGNMQGLYLATIGYDAKITPKLYTNVNVGAAWAAHNNGLKPVDGVKGQNATNYMGTEINLETGYKMYDNLTASLQAAYVVLGGYYKGSSAVTTAVKDPENPYTIRTSLIYNF